MINENEENIPKLEKIKPDSVNCMFSGYATNNKAYQVMAHMAELSDG